MWCAIILIITCGGQPEGDLVRGGRLWDAWWTERGAPAGPREIHAHVSDLQLPRRERGAKPLARASSVVAPTRHRPACPVPSSPRLVAAWAPDG